MLLLMNETSMLPKKTVKNQSDITVLFNGFGEAAKAYSSPVIETIISEAVKIVYANNCQAMLSFIPASICC